MILCYLLILCVVFVRGQINTRVSELEINSAVSSDNLIVISGLDVYKDELVVLDTYSGIITVRTESMSVAGEYFDRINLTHVYSTVDDDTGVVGLCTNKRGRCQYMNVTTLSVLGYGDNLILAGEQEEVVDIGVFVLLANTNTFIPSLFTVSGNAATIGKSISNPLYPIITAQLKNPLIITADLTGQAQSITFVRRFIAIFKSGGYVYIVSDDGGIDIRVTRICESDSLSDTAFHSLYQTTLTPCGFSGSLIVIDTRLVVLLTNGVESNYVIVTYESHGRIYVCAYSLSSINQAMTDTYQSCVVHGMGTIPQVTLFSVQGSLSCLVYEDNADITITECNLWPIGFNSYRVILETSNIGGTLITTTTTITTATTLSSILVTSTTDNADTFYYMYIVVEHYIDKYLLNGSSLVEPALERLTFSERITGVQKDKSGNNIFAITNSRLLRIPVNDCERHPTCMECVSDRDPLCGWCSIENTCNRRSLCPNSNLVYRWISDNVNQCTSVNDVTPKNASINIQTDVTLQAINLPQLSENEAYQCVFSSYQLYYTILVTSVNGDSSHLRGPINGTADIVCPVPTTLSPFTESDTRVYDVSLSTSSSNNNIASVLIQAFTILDCGFNTNCTSCTNSDSPCGWCLYNSRCVSDLTMCDMQEWIEPTENADRCPRVDSLEPDSLLIPGLERTNITLLGSNLTESTKVNNYSCILEFEGYTIEETFTVPGIWSNVSDTINKIDCVISADTLSREGSIIVQLTWGVSNYTIRREYDLVVSVYLCENQQDCYNCLQNPGCNWCNSYYNGIGECSSFCAPGMNISTSQGTCPHPIISNFTPVTTTVCGILELQLNGYNLFVRDRGSNVKVGDLDCDISSQNLTVLTCYLQTSSAPMTSKINLTVNGVSTLTAENFITKVPLIKNIYPLYTPQYGGSNITIYGDNLFIGASRTITSGRVCDILETWSNDTDDMILCETSRYDIISNPLMTISIDSMEISYRDEFVVLEDPQVFDMYLSGYNTPLRATSVSGGVDYELIGMNLGATVTQILEFSQDGRIISRSVCIPPNKTTGTRLVCPGEKFLENTVPLNGSAIRFELIMDSVPSVTTPFFQLFEFTLIPDPEIPARDINQTITILEGERLHIEILNIGTYPRKAIAIGRRVSDELIDTNICVHVTYTSDNIVCVLNYTKTGQIELEIVIGLNANEYILHRSVQISPADGAAAFFIQNGVTLATVCILVIIGIMIALTVIPVCICVWIHYKVRTKEYNSISKYLNLEISNVEKEMVASCVKGFICIVNDSESDNEMQFNETIPLLDFQTFAIRILFPNSQDHSVLHPLEIPPNHNSAIFTSALHKFESLLHDEQFVLAMVHSMEDNPNFNLKSRSDVASLLTISLSSSMPYLTEVLFDLLRELINRNVTRGTSKQLFERSESVADMLLTDWLAFNMYSELRSFTSVGIYRLFLRMKSHFESAPIDVVTGNATNSLSYEKIICKDIKYEVLCVDIETADGRRMTCKLLDCYTITQAKIKMMDQLYRGIGFLQRPKLNEVDLVLRFGAKDRLLRDNDMTNEEDEEWRRINTLSHYEVEDGMLLALVVRTQNLNPGQVWDCPGTSIYEYGITRRISPFGDERSKMYQLEKKESIDVNLKQNMPLRRSQYRSEIFLPRLVATKRVLQSSVDNLFEEMIPNIQPDSSSLDGTIRIPKVIKVLFDFLDIQGALYDVRDQEIVHTWKSNSLVLKFWANLLKYPECLLDVAMGETQESALTVIAQAFIDGCSSGKSHVTKESPTNKLLYNKEVQVFKARVKNYYEEVRNAPFVDKATITIPTQEYLPQGDYTIFNTDSTIYQLFNYAQSYRPEIWRRLCMSNMDRQREIFRQACLDIGDNLYGGEDAD